MFTHPQTLIQYQIREISPIHNIDTLQAIGKFRYMMWNEETEVNKEMFPDGCWIESSDATARHWIAENIQTQEIVAVARLTYHETLQDNLDGYLWIEKQFMVPEPCANISKLIVHSSVRKLGIGQTMSDIRIQAAKDMGAKSILVTASAANARILYTKGFTDSGIRVFFPNRPQFEFLGLQLIFPSNDNDDNAAVSNSIE